MTTTMNSVQANPGVTARESQQVSFVPLFDIWEKEHEWFLQGDMPGVTSENLEIHFENGNLVIHGKVAPRHQGLKFLIGEYGIGDFERTFSIGEAVDVEQISAELRDGVLTLHLPKSEKVKPRRIEVKVG